MDTTSTAPDLPPFYGKPINTPPGHRWVSTAPCQCHGCRFGNDCIGEGAAFWADDDH